MRKIWSISTRGVVDLWQRCGLLRQWNDPYKDISRKLLVQPDCFLVGIVDLKVVSTVMVGFEGHRGWINYLAVDPEFLRQGLGRKMMNEAERLLQDFGCPKVNLQIREDNLEALKFYECIGFSEDKVVSFGKRLIADD
ncbi:GNAT family acetyltransferase [Acaryochloris marina]|uniref:GNAT family acetyltransferase n=1 Tax=Acaryochloris marina TaxID=155978 RepID=UPI0021C3E23E|nr:GNAT family acetyltransferase [Acaryochloris marina]BDM83579.1 GNAT family acetyltransferase [Acaryochloris marina MBIC10699]